MAGSQSPLDVTMDTQVQPLPFTNEELRSPKRQRGLPKHFSYGLFWHISLLNDGSRTL